MKLLLKVFLVILIIAILLPLLIAAYFGFIPWLSPVFGSNQPRDLGVTYTEQNYTNTHNNFGVEVTAINSAPDVKNSLVYTGKHDVNLALSSADITGYVAAETWKYAPISKIQVKINADGTGEASGILNLDNILPFISMTTPVDEVQKAIDKFQITSNPPFYAKGKVSVVNNKASFIVQSLEIGRIPVPNHYIAENTTALNDFVTDRLNYVPNLQIRKLELVDGKVIFDGTVPDKVTKLVK